MIDIFVEAIQITVIVFIMMIVVELMELRMGGFLRAYITTKPQMQYLTSALLGLVPGCSGTFFVDTLYISGIVSFGALVTVMISTFGDEAFVLFSSLSDPTMEIHLSDVALLMGILFVVGILGGLLSDNLVAKYDMVFATKCEIPHHIGYEDSGFSWKHFFGDHIFRHILIKHIPPLFAWLFGSLVVVHFLEGQFHAIEYLKTNSLIMLGIATIVGILPLSGPNVVFIALFGKGAIPLSVLVANSIVQDGHGLLPMLSFSLSDSLKVKIVNVVIGFSVGLFLLLIGL